jgi:hypothetical protein
VQAGETWARTIGFEWDCGGVVFMDAGNGVYDGYLLFLPGAENVVAKVREAFAYLFAHGAEKVTGEIPTNHKRARRIAVAAGMRLTHTQDGIAHYALARE